MSEAKFIPGPYCVESIFSEATVDVCLGYEIPGAGSPYLIASIICDDEDNEFTASQYENTAKLFAASPLLYAELSKIVRACESNGYFRENGILAEAKSVLAKVEDTL